MKIIALRTAASLSTVVLVAAAILAGTGQPRKAAADATPSNADMKSLFEEKCSACHDVPDPVEHGFTKAQWQTTVNRMLTAHGASSSISDVQAAEIVDYLGQFAPKPGGDTRSNDIGVWENDPAVSLAYPFTYPPNLDNFSIYGGAWKVISTPDTVSGYLKHVGTGESASMIVENKHTLSGGLDLETQFHINQANAASAVGIVFGVTDARNYLAAEFAPSTGVVSLCKVTDGTPAVLQQTTFDSSQTGSPDGWHNIRVKVTEGGAALEVLMDYQQQIKSTYPEWQGGRVGLISTGPVVVGFRQLTIDSYDSDAASPAGDVLLH